MSFTPRQLPGITLALLLAGPALGQTAPPPEPAETQEVEVQNLNAGSEGVQAVAAFQASIKRNEPAFAKARPGSPAAVEIATRLVSSYEGLGVAYVQTGDCEKAVAALGRAIELSREVLHQEEENALYARSMCYTRTGKPQDSIADLERLLQTKENLQYREELAGAYAKLGRKDDALQQYKKLLESNPNNSWWNFQSGYLYAEKQDYEAAAAAYEKAIASRGQLPESAVASAWNNLGGAYFRLCKKDEAIAAFKKASALNSAFSEGLGAAYLLNCPPAAAPNP
jgi:tetratricopeptide (TPR) repeat protein